MLLCPPDSHPRRTSSRTDLWWLAAATREPVLCPHNGDPRAVGPRVLVRLHSWGILVCPAGLPGVPYVLPRARMGRNFRGTWRKSGNRDWSPGDDILPPRQAVPGGKQKQIATRRLTAVSCSVLSLPFGQESRTQLLSEHTTRSYESRQLPGGQYSQREIKEGHIRP